MSEAVNPKAYPLADAQVREAVVVAVAGWPPVSAQNTTCACGVTKTHENY